jgi:hypothetical protein
VFPSSKVGQEPKCSAIWDPDRHGGTGLAFQRVCSGSVHRPCLPCKMECPVMQFHYVTRLVSASQHPGLHQPSSSVADRPLPGIISCYVACQLTACTRLGQFIPSLQAIIHGISISPKHLTTRTTLIQMCGECCHLTEYHVTSSVMY